MYIDTIENQKLHQLISSAPINAKIEIRTGLHCLYDTLMDVSYAKKNKETLHCNPSLYQKTGSHTQRYKSLVNNRYS